MPVEGGALASPASPRGICGCVILGLGLPGRHIGWGARRAWQATDGDEGG